MKLLRVLFLLILLFIAVAAYPHEKTFACNPVAQIINQAFVDGKAFTFTALTDDAEVLQFYINKETREWTMIAIDGKFVNRGCKIKSGTGWHLPWEPYL